MIRNREELLHQLELVSPGLSTRDIVEHSSCFIFKEGRVYTFNDEIFCSVPCDLGFEGAVASEPLLKILAKMPDESLEVVEEEGAAIFKGKRRRAEIRLQTEITDMIKNIEAIEQPTKWKLLAEDFIEAVDLVKECAATDQSTFVLTCIHICPDRVEAADDYQTAQVKIDTKFAGPALVRRDSMKHVCMLSLTRFAETEKWIHFKNKEGLKIACRRAHDLEYPDVSEVLKIEGAHTSPLPKGMGEICERAEVFSADNPDDNLVKVEFVTGRVKVTGRGTKGAYTESRKINYKGEGVAFYITPKLLGDLTSRYDQCELSSEKLMVGDGRFCYVTVLGTGEDISK